MPLYRFITPPPDLADATYLYDENPDPSRFEEVVDKPAKKAQAAEDAPVA